MGGVSKHVGGYVLEPSHLLISEGTLGTGVISQPLQFFLPYKQLLLNSWSPSVPNSLEGTFHPTGSTKVEHSHFFLIFHQGHVSKCGRLLLTHRRGERSSIATQLCTDDLKLNIRALCSQEPFSRPGPWFSLLPWLHGPTRLLDPLPLAAHSHFHFLSSSKFHFLYYPEPLSSLPRLLPGALFPQLQCLLSQENC